MKTGWSSSLAGQFRKSVMDTEREKGGKEGSLDYPLVWKVRGGGGKYHD